MMWTSFELKIWSWTSLQPSPPLMHSKGDTYQRTRSSSPFPSFSPLPFFPSHSCHLPPPYAFLPPPLSQNKCWTHPSVSQSIAMVEMLEIFGHCIVISQSFWGSHLISLLLSHYDQYGDFRAVAAAELAEKKEQEAEESAKVASAMKPSYLRII